MEGFGDFYDFTSFSSNSTNSTNHYQQPKHQQFTQSCRPSDPKDSGYGISSYNPFAMETTTLTQEENHYQEIEDVKIPQDSLYQSSRYLAIYRGSNILQTPVSSDFEKRTIQMKNSAKTLQFQTSSCQFVVLAFEEDKLDMFEFIGQNSLGKLIISIPFCNLDLARNSKKDRTFFYFTTSNSNRDLSLLSDGGRNTQTVCYVFHSFTPKIAAVITSEIQRHHNEERLKIRETILRNINFDSESSLKTFAPQAKDLNEKFKLGFGVPNNQDLNNNGNKAPPTHQKTENAPLLNFDDCSMTTAQMFETNPFLSSTPLPPAQPEAFTDRASGNFQLIDDLFSVDINEKVCGHLPPLPEQFRPRIPTPLHDSSSTSGNSSTSQPSIKLVRTFAPGMDPNFDVITGEPIDYANIRRPLKPTNPFVGLNFTTESESVFHQNSSKTSFGQRKPVERRSSFSKDFDQFLSQTIQTQFKR